ncbi:MAG: aminotransferase class III-fold pyridoxal phosphate-dependent enzyme, partial [Caulobacteraceae bacterium]
AWMIPCKNGSDATLIALMAARAHSRRRTVILARGAYHGCHPWSAQRRSGTLPEEKAHQIFCDYNDAAGLEEAARQAGEDLAAIFAAPLKHDAFIDQALPDPAYAAAARRICDETGALLVVDDVRAGLRLARDCSWSLLGVEPDLSCWGKCLANGHALSAVLGSEKVRGAAERIFVTGSFWCEAAPMAAALATLKRVRETAYLEHIQNLGEKLRVGIADLADRHGIGLRQSGPTTMPLFLFDEDPDMRRGFFFASEMLKRGIYTHPWHNMFFCAALTEADIAMTLEAADEALEALRANLGRLEPVEKMAFLAA